MQSKFLITTADERTWKKNVPILFLGEWCRVFTRRHVWGSMEAEVVPYHWDNRAKFNKDYEYLQSLYERLLPKIANKLNEIHGVNYSLRYWRLLIGPWLGGMFIPILFDRWSMLKEATERYSISATQVLCVPEIQKIANDFHEFTQLMINDEWNSVLHGDLIQRFFNIKTEVLSFPDYYINNQKDKSKNRKTRPFWQKLSTLILLLTQRMLHFFVKESDAFFLSTGLPFKQQLKFYLRLKQAPAIWGYVNAFKTSVDISKRKWIFSKQKDEFENVVLEMLPIYIPRLYLEGYVLLQEQLSSLPWPQKPKFVFTSNAIIYDDLLKGWVALQTEKQIPLILVQHGGGYGTSRVISIEEHEIKISDKYLTWGWENKKYSHIIPAFMLKSNKPNKCQLNTTALLVTTTYPRQSYKLSSEAISSQWLRYFDDLCTFTSLLPEELCQKLIVRLSPYDFGWCQKERWLDKFPNINLDEGACPILPLIKQCRIYISTYNGTTYLESLSQNIPTIIFWDTTLWELRVEELPYFERLKEVGIFHNRPESAAKKFVEVWNNVMEWWNDETVQRARIYFCNRFARTTATPVKELLTIIDN